MGLLHNWRLRRLWVKAQEVHAMEFENKLPHTLSCTAVGHWQSIDDYSINFDKDARRKFLIEYREGMFK
jgi:hypothetical protein